MPCPPRHPVRAESTLRSGGPAGAPARPPARAAPWQQRQRRRARAACRAGASRSAAPRRACARAPRRCPYNRNLPHRSLFSLPILRPFEARLYGPQPAANPINTLSITNCVQPKPPCPHQSPKQLTSDWARPPAHAPRHAPHAARAAAAGPAQRPPVPGGRGAVPGGAAPRRPESPSPPPLLLSSHTAGARPRAAGPARTLPVLAPARRAPAPARRAARAARRPRRARTAAAGPARGAPRARACAPPRAAPAARPKSRHGAARRGAWPHTVHPPCWHAYLAPRAAAVAEVLLPPLPPPPGRPRQTAPSRAARFAPHRGPPRAHRFRTHCGGAPRCGSGFAPWLPRAAAPRRAPLVPTSLGYLTFTIWLQPVPTPMSAAAPGAAAAALVLK
jgi:hypothetical protein